MLSFLVTNASRRVLLQLLWSEDATGSVSELARRAGLSFGSAYRELEAMRTAGLVNSERVGSTVVYKATADHRQAGLLRQLVADPDPAPAGRRREQETDVRSWLVALGAPFWAPAPTRPIPPLEEVVVAGLELAHYDATVARVFPVVLWRHRHALDMDKLRSAATQRNEGPTLGYFLELTGRLGGDRRLAAAAGPLRDRRRTATRLFFSNANGRMALAAAKAKTPRLAKKWGYLMNMEREAFASAFAKHATSA